MSAAKGSLERRRVREIMSSPAISLIDELPVSEAARVMVVRRIGGLLIRGRHGRPTGFLSASDIVRHQAAVRAASAAPDARPAPDAAAIRKIMTPIIVTVAPSCPVKEAAATMWRLRTHRLLVADRREVLGIVTAFDIARRAGLEPASRWEGAARGVAEVMGAPLESVGLDASVQDAARRMSVRRVSALPVLSRKGAAVGVVSASDIVRYEAVHRTAFLRLAEIARPSAGNGSAGTRPLVLREEAPLSLVMTPAVNTVPVVATAGEAARLMGVFAIHRVFVEGRDGLVGVVTAFDVARALGERRGAERSAAR